MINHNYNTKHLDVTVLDVIPFAGKNALLIKIAEHGMPISFYVEYILHKVTDDVFVEMNVTTGDISMQCVINLLGRIQDARSIYPMIWKDHEKEITAGSAESIQ